MRRFLDRTGLGLLSPITLLLLAVFVAPVLVMFPTSLRPYVPGHGIADGWTLENYAVLLEDPFYLEVILRTLALGCAVTLLALVIGYPLAYFLARTRSRMRNWIILLVVFPLLLNLVVRSFGWITLLANHGVINEALIAIGLLETPIKLMFNLTGLIIGMTHIFLPFMILVLMGAIQNIPRDVEEASAVAGATRMETFRHVVLPLSAPGMLGGGILVFILTISALVTPRLLGGPTYKVMSTLIFDEFMQLLDWPGGSALAFVLTALALLLIWLSSLAAGRWMVRR